MSYIIMPDGQTDQIRILQDDFDLKLGESKTIEYRAFPAADASDIRWSSSDPEIVSVENGTVTALGYGFATITAKCGSASDSLEIEAYVSAESFDLVPAECGRRPDGNGGGNHSDAGNW